MVFVFTLFLKQTNWITNWPMTSIQEFYKDKGVFLTGSTGFIGKVIVEKFLWSLPDVKQLYLLVRKKKGKDGKERLKELLDSPIMKRLKERHGKKFYEWAYSKLTPVYGDVSSDELFVTQEQQKELFDKVNIIIHSAATIGFFEKLDHAFQLNTLGTLRMFEFAKKCTNLESFCHISTCYVNANMVGKTVEEKIYPLHPPDWKGTHEEYIKKVLSMSEDEITKLTPKLLDHFKHPNTYTTTKSFTEQILIKKRGKIPLAICRPSIVGASVLEPYPGWIDGIGAAAGIYLSAGLGVSHILPGNPKAITDQVPVDMVVNGCIMAAAYVANKDTLQVFHLGTSSINPVTWGMIEDGVLKYWTAHTPKSAVSNPDLHIINSDFIYNLKFFLLYSSVARAYGLFSKVFPTKKNLENAKMLNKVESKVLALNDNFKYFCRNEWIFDTSNLVRAEKFFEKEKKIFFVDPKLIDWSTYFQQMCYGIHKWIIKEDPDPPTIMKSDIVKQNSVRMFSDITFAYDIRATFTREGETVDREQMKKIVLKSKRVQDAIQKEAQEKSLKFVQVEDQAVKIMEQMFSNPKTPIVRLFAWYLRKVWRQMYSSIVVDEKEIERIKKVYQDRGSGSIIIMPTHRSYIDFLITSYIFLAYKLPLPHIAAGEDFLNMSIVQSLFRYSGAFFIKRQFANDELYKAVFTEYCQQLLIDQNSIEFFTEGTRSREGKTLPPKTGLLNVIVDAFLDKKVSNITILPIHINYEKFMEGNAYSRELLGEKKTKESLKALLQNGIGVLKTNHGDISVSFANPISLDSFLNPKLNPYESEQDKKKFVNELSNKIIQELNDSSRIMPTALISSILLANRHGMSKEELILNLNYLKGQVIKRGGKMHYHLKDSSIDRSLKLLKDMISTKGMIEIKSDGLKNFLHLSIYRNQILHLFYMESIICIVLETRNGMDLDSLILECQFLKDLLSLEFIGNERDWKQLLDQMVIDGIIKENQNNYFISSFKSSHLLTSMIFPFIESYWLSGLTLFSFHGEEKTPLNIEQLIIRAQWLANKLYKQGKTYYYESISKIQLGNAFNTFLRMGILTKSKQGFSLSKEYSTIDHELGFVGKIGKFRKMEIGNSFLSKL